MNSRYAESFWDKLNIQLEGLIVIDDHEECRQLLANTNPRKIPRDYAE